jgi:hypothetical protein
MSAAKPYLMKPPRGQRRERARHNGSLGELEGKLDALGNPPANFTAGELEHWNWYKLHAKPPAKEWDRPTVILFAKLMAKLEDGTLSVSESQVLRSVTRDCGMDPVSRSKVRAPSEPETKQFDLDA